jgi:hypothetical protein
MLTTSVAPMLVGESMRELSSLSCVPTFRPP